MAYGPLAQCAFMSGPPPIRKKSERFVEKRPLYDTLPLYKAPDKSEPCPPGQFLLMAFDAEEAKAEAVKGHACRSMELDDVRCQVFGSSQEHDGQVFDGHKSVNDQHACIFFNKGKWFVKAINGNLCVESITFYPHIRDDDGKAPKRYTSTGNKKLDSFSPIDPKRRLTAEMCVFRLGDSDRRFWLKGPLGLGEGEMEEKQAAPKAETKTRERKERREKDKEREKGHEKEKDRKEDRKKDRSRSRRGRR